MSRPRLVSVLTIREGNYTAKELADRINAAGYTTASTPVKRLKMQWDELLRVFVVISTD